MGDLSRLAFLNARVSLYAARLQPADSLLSYIDSTHELPADYLEAIGLSCMADRQPSYSDEIEQHLMTCLVDEAEGLMHAMPPETRGIIKQWMRRFEFMNLKSLIRCKLTNCDLDLSREYLLDIGHFARLPLDEVDRCPEDIFNRILWRAMKGPDTPYPEWAVRAAPDDDD